MTGFGQKEILAVGVAGCASLAYLFSGDTSSRLVKANSGTVPDGLQSMDTKMVRRPSWETKFAAPELSQAAKSELDGAAKARLQRRPSWSAKFEGQAGDGARLQATTTLTDLDAAASARLQRRPSWSAKFEGHEGDAALRAAYARDALAATASMPPGPFNAAALSMGTETSPDEVSVAVL